MVGKINVTAEMIAKYEHRARRVHSLLCVGLDSSHERLPERFKQADLPQFAFNQWIIEQTQALTAAYKCNIAFYEEQGETGIRALQETVAFLREQHPDILTICDAKRGDIDSTNAAYANAIFDGYGFDAVTLHPYTGQEGLAPFLQRTDRACIILCRTSNPGAGEFQDLEVGGRPLWQAIAERVATAWNAHGNCMLVIGATYPDELRRVREIVGDMTLLIPGIGTQGGEVAEVIAAGLNSEGLGLIVNASRSVIFADNPAAAARALRDEINTYR